MSNVPLLFWLPNDLIVSFLSEWLDLPAVGKLDTIVSSRLHRPRFLRCLQDMRLPFLHFPGWYRSNTCRHRKIQKRWWRWMSSRQIYIEYAVLHGGIIRRDLPLPTLRSIVAQDFHDRDLKYLVRNCPALKVLDLCSSPVDPLTETGLRYIAYSCPNLEYLFWYRRIGYKPGSLASLNFVSTFESTASSVMEILHRCSNLKMVSLTDTAMHSLDLTELGRFGHLFGELHIKDVVSGSATVLNVTNFLRKCTRLRSLILDERLFEVHDGPPIIPMPCCRYLGDLELVSILSSQAMDTILLGFRNCTVLSRVKMDRCALSDSSLRALVEITSVKDLSLDECGGLTDANVALIAKMGLQSLYIYDIGDELSEAFLQTFVADSQISQSLESLSISIRNDRVVDESRLRSAFAVLRRLKSLSVRWGGVRIQQVG